MFKMKNICVPDSFMRGDRINTRMWMKCISELCKSCVMYKSCIAILLSAFTL